MDKKRIKALNKDFLRACEECPGFDPFEDFQQELVAGGLYVTVSKLHKDGLNAVLKYWMDTDTIGGHVIWRSGYHACLSPDTLEIIKDWEKHINQFGVPPSLK